MEGYERVLTEMSISETVYTLRYCCCYDNYTVYFQLKFKILCAIMLNCIRNLNEGILKELFPCVFCKTKLKFTFPSILLTFLGDSSGPDILAY